MAKFRITRKLRQNNYALTVDGLGTSMSDFYKQWQAGGGAEKLGSFKDWYKGSNTGLAAKNAQLTANANARAAQRAANIANPGAAAAKAPIHAVVIRTAGLGDGDGAVLYGDDVAAASRGGDGEFLIQFQIYGFDDRSLAGNFREGGSGLRPEQVGAQPQAQRQKGGKKENPGSRFHREITSYWQPESLAPSVAKI